MKFSTVVIAAVAQVATAHYWMDTNIINGVAQPSYKYVRESTRKTKYNPTKFSGNPPADLRDGATIDGPDGRCNQGAFTNAGKTGVLTVNAGEEVRLKLAVGAKMQHPGPELVYMALAPDGGVQKYDGSGQRWFKIHELAVCDGGDFTSTAWCDYGRDYIAATIPKDTPNGEYLVRFEHIGVHRSHVNQPEHYMSCLQVKVVGGGNGTPGPLVSFPGAYKSTDPYANFSIYNGRKPFPMPGPKIWTGGAGGASGASGNSSSEPAKEDVPVASPTTLSTVTVPAATPAPAAGGAAAPAAGGAALYAQCGGQGFSGATTCATGTCKSINPYYSQCQN